MKGARRGAVSNKSDFQNVGRLIDCGQFTRDELLDAIQNGDVYLAVDADGFFVWPVEKQVNNKYVQTGRHWLYEKDFLYIASKYYQYKVGGRSVNLEIPGWFH